MIKKILEILDPGKPEAILIWPGLSVLTCVLFAAIIVFVDWYFHNPLN